MTLKPFVVEASWQPIADNTYSDYVWAVDEDAAGEALVQMMNEQEGTDFAFSVVMVCELIAWIQGLEFQASDARAFLLAGPPSDG